MPGLGKGLALGPAKAFSSTTSTILSGTMAVATVSRNKLGTIWSDLGSILFVIEDFTVGLALTDSLVARETGHGTIAGHDAGIVPHPIIARSIFFKTDETAAAVSAQHASTVFVVGQWRWRNAFRTMAGNSLFATRRRHTPRRTRRRHGTRRKGQIISIVLRAHIAAPTLAVCMTPHARGTHPLAAFGRVAGGRQHFEVPALAVVETLAAIATDAVNHAALGRVAGQGGGGALVGGNFDGGGGSGFKVLKEGIVGRVGNVLF